MPRDFPLHREPPPAWNRAEAYTDRPFVEPVQIASIMGDPLAVDLYAALASTPRPSRVHPVAWVLGLGMLVLAVVLTW